MEHLPQPQALSVDPQAHHAHRGSRMRNPDVWFCIFEYVAEERQKKSVLALMLVNKTWKAIATPLLYRFIDMNQTNTDRLHEHLVRAQLRHDTLAVSTRELVLRAPSWDAETDRGVSSLLLFFPSLRSFACGTPVTCRELGPLFRACGHSLLSLDVILFVEGGGPELSLGIIGQMRALQTLKLCLDGIDQISHELYESLPGLQLPYLKTMEHRKGVDEYWEEHTRHLDYLRRCDFPVLVDLTLASPMFNNNFMFTEQGLGSFFLGHGTRLKRLSFHLTRNPRPLPSWITSTLAHLNTLTFLEGPPSEPTILDLPPSVCNLRIAVTGEDGLFDDEAELCRSMDALVTVGSTTSIKNVVLLARDFQWPRIFAADPRWSGEVLRWGLSLAEYGIALLDSDGKGISLRKATAEDGFYG